MFPRNRAGCDALHWQQQQCPLPRIGARVDILGCHAIRRVSRGFEIGPEKGYSERRNVERRCVVPGPGPSAVRVLATEKGSPVNGLFAVGGRGIRFGGFMATRTGVRRATWFHLAGADAQQMAFVLQDAPQFASHLRIVAPVAEAPAHTASASFRFERGEIFSAHQMTVIQQRQQNQQITGQMRQFSISTLIRFPTRSDALLVALDTALPSREMDRKGYSLLSVRGGGSGDQLFVALFAGFEAINLSTQPRLSAIKPSGIQKHRARELRERSLRLLAEIFGQFENRGGDE